MSKTLCELKKYLKHDLDAYILLVYQPHFVCTKCGRVANKKKYLCQPQKIEVEADMRQERADSTACYSALQSADVSPIFV
jgi:hypothetical protein